MHDQVLALKWVQQHVRNFGGDVNNVSIMGESAGAMSCFLHLVSPQSRGLFHKIIASSGSPSTPFLHLDRKPEAYGRAFATQLLKKKLAGRNKVVSDEELLSSLKELPANSLVTATTLFKDWEVFAPLQWKPCLDADQGTDAFLPLPFEQAIKEGKFDKNVSILTGCTAQEGLIFSTQFLKSPRRWRMLFNNWDHWAPLLFFNRETDLITLNDVDKCSKIKDKFFARAEGRNAVPSMKGKLSTSIFQPKNPQFLLVFQMDL